MTGGLGGIGCAFAEWLAEQGAGTVVLNGRRASDAAAEEAIGALRACGFRIEVELADVTDTAALDAMLARMDASLPPLAGVIHSVGVLRTPPWGTRAGRASRPCCGRRCSVPGTCTGRRRTVISKAMRSEADRRGTPKPGRFP